MSARPNLFCKFRNWRVTAEKDSKTGTYIERHRTKDMLATGQFYCQPPRFFDDPHDGLQGARATGSHRDIDRFLMHNLDGVPEIMRKHKLSSITQLSQVKDAEDQKALGRLARKHSRRETRVLSLSAEPGNELMWSFYGDNHRGICLCFDSQHAYFNNARSVQYVDDPNKIAEPTDDIPVNDPLLYTKAESWAWQFQQAGFDDLIKTLVQGGYQAAIFQMERLPRSFDYQAVPLGQIEARRTELK